MNFKARINIEKRICDLILIVGLGVAYVVLSSVGVSPSKFILQTEYREIDWSLFTMKPSQTTLKDKFAAPEQADDNYSLKAKRPNIPTIESFDVTSHIDLPRRKIDALKMPPSDRKSSEINFSELSRQVPDLTSLTFDNIIFPLFDQHTPTNFEIEGPAIEIDSPPNVNTKDYLSNKLNTKNDMKEITEDKIVPEPEVVKIELRPDDLNEDDKDLSPIIHELIVWMKENPALFSDVFKKFLNFESGNLTSQTKFKIDIVLYELFLLCKVNILEIRICLVENEKLILLIDSGLKEKSNYLRIGTIKRADDGSIVSFISSQKTPSPELTEEFYKIFLSWWENVKDQSIERSH